VALDRSVDQAQAYIFDPGVVSRDVADRDLAVLEVSVLLHQRLDPNTLTQVCSAVYETATLNDSAATVTSPVGKSVVEFVLALRKAAESVNDLDISALMVFDFALIQLGGLAIESSGNMIWDQRSAVQVLAFVTRCERPAEENIV
jgi:hypothetical protein